MSGAPQTGRALHVDQALSNILINRRPVGFIADMLLPITPVSKQTDFYWTRNHLEGRRYEPGLSRRAPGAKTNKVAYTVGTDTYVAKNYGLGAEWTLEDEINADEILQWAENHTGLVGDRLMVDFEFRVAELATNTSNVGTVTTISSAWSDPDNSTPFTDLNTKVEQFRQRTGLRPNTLVIPRQVASNLRANAQIRSLLFGSNEGGLVTADRLASLLEIERVLIPESQVNTADEQQTINGSGNLNDIWGPHVWMAHIRLLQGRDVDTWINAFRWTNPRFGVPMAVRRLPFDQETLTQKIDAMYWQDEKIVNADLAERIANVSSSA